MTERNKFLAYALENHFPHPIAAPFRCAQTSQRGTDKAAFCLATVDGFLRYIGSVLLADFFAKGPSPEKVDAVLNTLLYPTFAKWADEILSLAAQTDSRDPFVPELTRALVQKGGRPSQTGQQLKALAERCVALLEDKPTLLNPEQAETVATELAAELVELLDRFTFLERYPLVVFRRHAAESDNGFRGFMLRWMGYRSEPLPVGVEFEGTVPLGVPLLLAPDAHRGLELSPFVTVEAVPNRRTEALFLCAGLRHQGAMRLENFSTGRFLISHLTVKDSPATLPDYMASWNDGGRLASLTPTETTEKRLRFTSKLLPSEKVLEGRYKNLGFIGRGGIGAVYRVYDMEEAADKAVKILYPDLSRNEFFTRYFVETGTVLSRLESPNLVPVYEAGYSSTLQENHIVMAHMGGGSLAELLERRETLGPREALRIGMALLDGLERVHEGGLVHGGIHPGNILFDDEGTPRLADFGILRLPSSRVTTFRPLERLHSLRYASPELLLGGQASTRSDLYSAAIVIYEMLTGRVPSKTEFVAPSELIFPIPEELDRVLHKALASAPEQRFGSATDLRGALAQIEAAMGTEYEVSPTAQAQQLVGHLSDILSGHTEQLDVERAEKMAAGDFEAAARLLHLKVDELWDINERVYWMQQLAHIYFEKLDKPGKAVSIYRDCLELAPDNPVAVRAIVEHFEKTEQWEELAEILSELKEQTEQVELQAEYLEQLVHLHHARLGDAKTAAEYLEELVEKVGAQQRSVELLVRLKEEAQDWTGAARALEKWKEAATDREQKVGILRRLAAIYHKELDEHDAAVATYEQLVELDAADGAVLQGLRSLYRAAFSYASLAGLLRRMVASDDLPRDEKVELYQELGEILSSYLYESREAIEVWNELLALDPTNHTALSYLERLYLREGRNDAYLAILEQKIAATTDPEEKASVLLTAARARMEFLDDAAGARKLLEEGHELAPTHKGIERALEQLYGQHGDTEAQSRILLSQLERETALQKRLEILRKLAALFEQGEDFVAAFEVLKRTYTEAPMDPSVRQGLEKAAAQANAWEELVTFYMERLAQPGEEGESPYLASRIAAACAQHISDPDKSVYALEKAAELYPDSDAINRSLLTVFRDAERWADLAALMIRSLRSAEESRRAELFEEVALLIKNRLGAREHSRMLLEELVRATEEVADPEALRALTEACKALEQWQLLADVSERLLERENDPARAQKLRLEIGGAYMQLVELDKARQWLEAALDKSPHDADLQKALEDTLAAAEDWEGLVAFYRRLLPIVTDAESRIGFMERAAEIEFNVFGKLDAAIELYRRLTALRPESADYASRLAEALKKAERYTELTWQYEQMAQRLEGEEKKALLREMAEVYYERLRNPDAAIQTLRNLLRETPEDQEVFERARSICLEEKRFETLLRLLGDRARQTTDEDQRLLHRVEMARLSAMEMGLFPPAKTYLDEVLAARPGHAEAFTLYRDLLERQEDWKGLVELLGRQYKAETDEPRKVELGLELARLQLDRLDLKVAAVEVLEDVWELSPDNTRPGLLLARTYASLARWDKTASLLAVLREQAENLSEEEGKELIFLSAQAHEALIERPSAITYYRKCIDLGFRVQEAEEHLALLLYMEESYQEARPLVSRLLDEGRLSPERTREFRSLRADIDQKLGRRDRSRGHLENMLSESPGDLETLRKLLEICREEGDAEGEAEALEQILEVETDPERRFPLLVRLGDLLKGLPERLEDSARALERAFEIRPDSKVVAVAMGDVYTRLGRWEDASRCLREAEELETDTVRKATFAMAQAVLFLDHTEDVAAGEAHLHRVLEYDANQWDAFSRLEQLAVDRADWAAQRSLYEATLERLGSTPSRDLGYKLHLNLGQILLEKFEDTDAALAHLEAAGRFRPDSTEPLQLAAGVYLQMEDGLDRALDAYKKLVQATPRDVELLQMLRKTYSKMKRYDDAWYVASVLELLGEASEKERAFYRKFSTNALKLKPRVIDAERFRRDLAAPEEDWQLSEILRIVFERMASRLELPALKNLGHSRKTLLEDAQSGLYGKLAATIAKVLGIPHPQTYLRETSGWLVKEGCFPAVLAMGPDLLDKRKGKDLRYELARTLSLFLPQHQLVGLLDRETLRTVLGNVLKLAVSSFPEPPGDPRQNLELRKEMERAIPPVERDTIRDLVGQLREKGGELSVKRWFVGVEKTSVRTGMLFANDLLVAAEMVQAYPVHYSVAPREELVDDLIAFVVSDGFARLRDHLGITVL